MHLVGSASLIMVKCRAVGIAEDHLGSWRLLSPGSGLYYGWFYVGIAVAGQGEHGLCWMMTWSTLQITNSADECPSASNKTSSGRVKVITKELESQHMVGDRLGFTIQVPLLAWVVVLGRVGHHDPPIEVNFLQDAGVDELQNAINTVTHYA